MVVRLNLLCHWDLQSELLFEKRSERFKMNNFFVSALKAIKDLGLTGQNEKGWMKSDDNDTNFRVIILS